MICAFSAACRRRWSGHRAVLIVDVCAIGAMSDGGGAAADADRNRWRLDGDGALMAQLAADILQRALGQSGQHMTAIRRRIVDEVIDHEIGVRLNAQRALVEKQKLRRSRGRRVDAFVVLSLTGLTAVAVPTCCAMAGPAATKAAATKASATKAAASGSAIDSAVMARRRSLANDRQLSADPVDAAGLDQRRGAEVELPDMRKHADDQNKTCAQKADDHDLQVRLTISAIDRMIHGCLRFLA